MAQRGPPQVPGCASAADCLRFNPGCSAAIPGCLCSSSIFWTQAANCACSNCTYQDFEGFYNWADHYCYQNNAVVAGSFQSVACVNPDFSLTGKNVKAGPIAGAVAGGIAALALLVTIGFVVAKVRSRKHIELPQEEEMQTYHVGPKQ